MFVVCVCYVQFRDYGKAKVEKVQSKPEAAQKARKPKEKKEGVDEGGWQTVPKKGSGQLTKQVDMNTCICFRVFNLFTRIQLYISIIIIHIVM